VRLGALAAVAVVLVLLAGCGGGSASPSETTSETIELKVYGIKNGRLWPVRRVVPFTESVERTALDELLAAPTDQEFEELSLRNYAVPSDGDLQGLEIEDALARVESTDNLREDGLGQIVFTLTQFPAITSVEVTTPEGTRTYGRDDFEKFTPPILVEDPLAYEEVTSPLRVTGTANTFEATFAYELTDTDGRIVDESFVTATSGTGTRGTFEFTTGAFEVPFDGFGALIVFENSAKDGSRVNLVEIPLRMSK
jgi:Immunoglobulin-like domain of bacterial spore germination/Sporulation and spore germination